MEMQENTTQDPTEGKVSKEKLLELYMDYVLEHGEAPKSVYKFSKDHAFPEPEFYEYFGNFDSLREEIWSQFFHRSLSLMKKDAEWEKYASREKLLLFFFTFFENLSANRSYVLCVLKENAGILRNLEQFKGLRKAVKSFARELIQMDNETQEKKIFKRNPTIFSEGIWVQTLFLLRFWMKDSSPNFEKTDIAIEKSVNTACDLFDSAPLERMMDFGKFLWKERMA